MLAYKVDGPFALSVKDGCLIADKPLDYAAGSLMRLLYLAMELPQPDEEGA